MKKLSFEKFGSLKIDSNKLINVRGGEETEGGVVYTDPSTRSGFAYDCDQKKGNITYYRNKRIVVNNCVVPEA